MNLLTNGSFEGSWHHPGGVAELQIPDGWTFWYAESDVPNPHDPAEHARFVRPEVRVLPKSQLPESEWPLFVLDGLQTLKAFKGFGAWFAGLSQTLDLPAGYYRFTVKVFADLVKAYEGGRKVWADDPDGHDGLLAFTLNGHRYDWNSLEPGQLNTLDLEFAADGETTIGADIMCPFALYNSGVFTDAWSLERVTDTEPSDRCKPRVQYKRVYNVIPQEATLEQAQAVLEATFERGETIGKSSDDAGLDGGLDDRNVVEWGRSEEEKPAYVDFYERYYPGVKLTFKPLPGQDTEPAQPPATTGMLKAGFHLQRAFDGWDRVLARCAAAGRPMAVVKIVAEQMENIARIREVSPKTLVVYRAVEPNQPDWFYNAADFGKALRDSHFYGLFKRAVELGFDVIESPMNEVIGTHNPDVVKKAVAFGVFYAHWCREESGGACAPGIINPGGGNPDHGAETALLVGAARAAIETRGYLMPHTYHPATSGGDLAERWMNSAQVQYDYHLRPILSWLKTFAAAGVDTSKLRFIFGEAGACGAYVNSEGLPGGYTSAGAGWRGADCLAGNLERNIALMVRYEELCQQYPQITGWQVFTQGFVKPWDNFQFNGEWDRFLDKVLA